MPSKEPIGANRITEAMLLPHLLRKLKGKGLTPSSITTTIDTSLDSYTTGETILKGNGLYLHSDGLVYIADSTTDRPVHFIASHSATIGTTVFVKTSRIITVADATFTIGNEVYLVSGLINVSTVPPTPANGIILQTLGIATASDTFSIDIGTPETFVI